MCRKKTVVKEVRKSDETDDEEEDKSPFQITHAFGLLLYMRWRLMAMNMLNLNAAVTRSSIINGYAIMHIGLLTGNLIIIMPF
jgi:hypothetical protein